MCVPEISYTFVVMLVVVNIRSGPRLLSKDRTVQLARSAKTVERLEIMCLKTTMNVPKIRIARM